MSIYVSVCIYILKLIGPLFLLMVDRCCTPCTEASWKFGYLAIGFQ